MIGGILLGPTLLHHMPWFGHPGVIGATGQASVELGAIIQFGMLVFMFVVGTELRLDALGNHRSPIVYSSIGGILLSALMGVLAVMAAPHAWGLEHVTLYNSYPWVVGIVLSLSAIPVIARLLSDMNLVGTLFADLALSCAAITDLICLTGFGIVSFIAVNARTFKSSWVDIIIPIICIAVSILLLRRNVQPSANKGKTPPMSLAVIIMLSTASLTQSIGLSSALGAFIAGVVVTRLHSEDTLNTRTLSEVANSVFAPLYFASIGLNLDVERDFRLGLVLIVLGIAFVGKIGGTYIGARLAQLKPELAISIGYALNARGAVGLILASTAFGEKLINNQTYVAFVVMCLVTSLTSGLLLKRASSALSLSCH